MNFIGKIYNLETLKALKNSNEEDVAFVEKENNFFKYIGSNWVKQMVVPYQELTISLYEINKSQILSEGKTMTTEEIKKDLIKYLESKNNSVYLVLCKELSYYTPVLVKDDARATADEVVDCLKTLGRIYCSNESDGIFEFWIKKDEEIYCFMFIDYDEGSIFVGGKQNA